MPLRRVIGLDYSVAHGLHLYHLSYRDIVSWIENGCRRYVGVSYRPKLHLRHRLEPLDLHVRHSSGLTNWAFRFLLPLIGTVRRDKTLPRFANYHYLWAGDGARPRIDSFG
jgi:hypothetical protein